MTMDSGLVSAIRYVNNVILNNVQQAYLNPLAGTSPHLLVEVCVGADEHQRCRAHLVKADPRVDIVVDNLRGIVSPAASVWHASSNFVTVYCRNPHLEDVYRALICAFF